MVSWGCLSVIRKACLPLHVVFSKSLAIIVLLSLLSPFRMLSPLSLLSRLSSLRRFLFLSRLPFLLCSKNFSILTGIVTNIIVATMVIIAMVSFLRRRMPPYFPVVLVSLSVVRGGVAGVGLVCRFLFAMCASACACACTCACTCACACACACGVCVCVGEGDGVQGLIVEGSGFRVQG